MKLYLALLAGFVVTLAAMLAAPGAGAADPDPWQDDAAHWLCRPGDSPNPCAGSLEGMRVSPEIPPPGQSLGYRVAPDPKVDCFYVYPTQSEQTTPNASWDKDPELLRPTINQAEQFSRKCRVFAPMYRQYTQWALADPSRVTDEVRDLAYNDLVNAWNTYLEKYNKGRGVIVISHSQGTSHMARLMADQVDNRPEVRSRIIGAYLIGGNVYVPKGEKVGGQFKHMPACSSGTETGCIVAYSTFLNRPAADSMFGRVDVGFWINPNPRPDPEKYEVMCVNPAGFNGDNGRTRVMVNVTAFLTPEAPQGTAPWSQYDGFYTTECRHEDGASWLQGEAVPGESNPMLDMLLSQAGSSNDGNPHGNLHLADVNLALDNLVTLAGTQSDAWLAKTAKRNSLLKQQTKLGKTLKQLSRKAKRAAKQCRAARKKHRRAARRTCSRAKKSRARVRQTKRKLARVKRQIGQLG